MLQCSDQVMYPGIPPASQPGPRDHSETRVQLPRAASQTARTSPDVAPTLGGSCEVSNDLAPTTKLPSWPFNLCTDTGLSKSNSRGEFWTKFPVCACWLPAVYPKGRHGTVNRLMLRAGPAAQPPGTLQVNAEACIRALCVLH